MGEIELPAPGLGSLNYDLYLKRLSEKHPNIAVIIEHLSEDDIKRLTQEAREAFEAKQREERQLTTAVVLDPQQHPELAYHQLRVLVSQLDLLHQAAGQESLQRQINPQDPQADRIRRVLQALEPPHETS